jgi:hypothetical protein
MNILALDLGTTTGWAICTRDGTVRSGSQSFAVKRMEAAGQRWLKFRAFLAEQRAQGGEIHAVYYEDVKQHAGTLAAHVYGGFLATIEAWCAAARAKGFAPVDDNHADALAILSLARELEGAPKVEAPTPF